jgi:hypothetical protein
MGTGVLGRDFALLYCLLGPTSRSSVLIPRDPLTRPVEELTAARRLFVAVGTGKWQNSTSADADL